MYPQDGETAEALLSNADTTLYQAKGQGRDCVRFFETGMNQRLLQYLNLEGDLRRAIAKAEFWLQYQPIVCLADGKVRGAEALSRWRRGGADIISPADFIPIAEQSGLIVPIGRWVLETAVQEARLWADAGHAGLYISINLSARQFREAGLANMIKTIMAKAGVNPAMIRLELTESTVMNDAEQAALTLHELHDIGCRLAIDDFGTGYSSLAYLKRFPIDVLKIDRAFVRDLETSHEDVPLIQAMVDMSRALGMSVVAEGIETQGQATLLQRLGCEFAQGYFFGRPVDSERFPLPPLS